MTGAVTSELDQQELAAPDPVEVEASASELTSPQSTHISTRIPFGFAKRFGVLVEGSTDQLMVLHKEGIRADVIMEVQRFLAAPFRLEAISDESQLAELRIEDLGQQYLAQLYLPQVQPVVGDN